MKYINFNINDYVRFKTLSKGEMIWHNHWGPDPKFKNYNPADDDGWRTEQLWAVMEVFGPHLWHGCTDIIEMVIQIPVNEDDRKK